MNTDESHDQVQPLGLASTEGLGLVERLRQRAGQYDEYGWHSDIELEAANEIEALRKDAERYRWLRAQHWDTAQLCVVCDPKDAVKLGRTCPSGDYLDIAVDDAMLIGRPAGRA